MFRMIVVGASFQGGVAAAVLRAQGVAVDGFADDNTALRGQTVHGVPVIGSIDDVVDRAGETGLSAFVAIGNNTARRRVGDRLRAAGVALVNAVHPSAVVMEGVRLGTGIFIAPGAVVMIGTRIEDDAVINTRASIDHDSRIRAGAYVSPGVCTAGGVDIGENAFIGVGASLGPKVSIGAHTVVGAGSVVLDDIPPGMFAAGVPAKVKRALESRVDWQRILGGRRPLDAP